MFFYSAPLGKRSIEISLSVCLCVCLCVREHTGISGTSGQIFTKFVVQISCGRGSVLIWRCIALRCYALPLLWMTSRLAVVGRMAMRG